MTTKDKTTSTKPATGKPATGKPATGKPATGKPATGKPATKPATTDKAEEVKATTTEKAKDAGKKASAKEFARKVYTKADIVPYVASDLNITQAEAKQIVDSVLNGILGIATNLRVGVNAKGKTEADILQFTGLFSLTVQERAEKRGYDRFKEQHIIIPARMAYKISIGTELEKDSKERFAYEKPRVEGEEKKSVKPAGGKKTGGKAK